MRPESTTPERRSTRLIPLILLGLLGLLGLGLPAAGVRAGDEPEVVSLEKAESEIALLDDVLGSSRSVNPEIVAALKAVSHAVHHLPPPPELVLEAVPEDATEEQRDEIEDQNRDREREWKKEHRKHGRAVERLLDDAADLFLDALKETDIHRASERNIREEVNIAAAQVLGEWDDPKIARKIQRVIERDILDAKHEVSPRLLREAFSALARIGDPKSLEWMLDEFTHTRSTPEKYVDQLVAAHQAMLLFPTERIPGNLRYEVVEQMTRIYSGVESQATQSSADPALVRAKIFWDRIGNGVIQVLQHYAGGPTNSEGVLLATVEEFRDWFRDHKNPRRAPWKDEQS